MKFILSTDLIYFSEKTKIISRNNNNVVTLCQNFQSNPLSTKLESKTHEYEILLI